MNQYARYSSALVTAVRFASVAIYFPLKVNYGSGSGLKSTLRVSKRSFSALELRKRREPYCLIIFFSFMKLGYEDHHD